MAQLADLYLKPPVDDFGTLDFKKYDEIFDIGYKYALPKIEEYVADLFQVNSGSPSRNSPSPTQLRSGLHNMTSESRSFVDEDPLKV